MPFRTVPRFDLTNILDREPQQAMGVDNQGLTLKQGKYRGESPLGRANNRYGVSCAMNPPQARATIGIWSAAGTNIVMGSATCLGTAAATHTHSYGVDRPPV